MASNKISRINEDIQRVIASLLRSVKDPRVNQGLISVTGVETTSDLRYSKIYLSVMGLRDEKEMMKGLKSASGFLRRELGAQLNLRYTPELVFVLDKSIEHGAKISEILNNLDLSSKPEEGNDIS
jgi:ribosome-binding factor A